MARLSALGHDPQAFSRVGEDGMRCLRTVAPQAEGMPGRPCFFLKEGRCSVYADRPEGCRIYPFVMQAEDGRVVRDEDCPFRQEFPRDLGLERRLKRVVLTLRREAASRVDPPS